MLPIGFLPLTCGPRIAYESYDLGSLSTHSQLGEMDAFNIPIDLYLHNIDTVHVSYPNWTEVLYPKKLITFVYQIPKIQ